VPATRRQGAREEYEEAWSGGREPDSREGVEVSRNGGSEE